MCAILGVFSSTSLSANLVSRFKEALSLTAHRGPDISTEVFLENALLGFNRLSIVGVKNGNQPISNEKNTIYLICNGEIYNYKELKKELKLKHKFITQSDCEVILHLYEEDPDNFASRLKGQFSFLIFDNNKNQLILCRDRFGINPLYYAFNKSQIIVSSELKSIISLDRSICSSLDPIGIKETFFLYGPTPPRTCFQNIFQVEPGKILTVDLATNTIINNMCYWHIDKARPMSLGKINRKFERLLTQAVKRRIHGDSKKVGVYLSGGVDSATVTSLLCQLGQKVEAFSISFHDKSFDETKFQKIISSVFGIPLHSIFGDNAIDQALFQTVWHLEQPLIRTAPIPLYLLSQLVRSNGFKYVCCGEGADEMLLGYPVFANNLCSVKDKLPNNIKLNDLFTYKLATGSEMVSSFMNKISTDWKLTPNSVRHMQFTEIYTKLTRYLLVQQGDRQSMSHGVEQRFPFLDEDLTDFLFSIPDEQFVNLFMNKRILRDIVSKSLPKSIAYRKKQGYLAPMHKQIYASLIFSKIISLSKNNSFKDVIGLYFDKTMASKLFHAYENKSLNDVEISCLLLIVTTYMLHNQFIGSCT